MKIRPTTLSAVFVATLIAGIAVTPASFGSTIDADSDNAPVIGDTDALSGEEKALYYSDAPKLINVDPASGDVISVQEVSRQHLNSLVESSLSNPQVGSKKDVVGTNAVSTGCTTTSPCWYGQVPAVHYKFTLGTTSGTWQSRTNFYTGNYFAKLCWLDSQANPFLPPTYCMPERNGKNAWINLGYAVTGKEVNLSTTR